MAIRRVSIGPGEVAGYFSRLKAGLEGLGVPCEHFVLSENQFSYAESAYFLQHFYQKIPPIRNSKNRLIKVLGWVAEITVRFLVLVYATIRCDVFVFSGFGSFLWFHELFLLRLFRKKIIVVFLGSDARPPYFSGRHLDDAGQYASSAQAFKEARSMYKKIQRLEKFADVIINHTATAQFFCRPFVRFAAVGMPIQITINNKNKSESSHTQPIRILHAPSRPKAKGSSIFRQSIDELRDEGYVIDFVELIGVSNATVLQELQQCDFVIDELYSDVPLAMLATEAAIFGKPVIVGGYYSNNFSPENPDSQIPPSLYVEPNQIKGAIKNLIEDVDLRKLLGEQAFEFVSTNWNSRKVAGNYLRLIGGDIPKHWISNPMDLNYCFGWGLSKENWRKQVGEYVAQLGDDALMLNHNPILKQKVLDELALGKHVQLS